MATGTRYHGWIVVERREDGRDDILVEYNDGDTAHRETMGIGDEGAEAAVAWWDRRIGERVRLLPTPLGALRVYTGERPENDYAIITKKETP